jgi:hypothetical protein
MSEVGTRVFAVKSSNEESIDLYGFGVYDGDFERPNSEDTIDKYIEELRKQERHDVILMRKKSWTASMSDDKLKEVIRSSPLIKNPRITLDNGEIIWGMECWWGPFEKWEEFKKGRAVNEVVIERASND